MSRRKKKQGTSTKKVIPVIILLLLLGGGGYYYVNYMPEEEPAGIITVHFIDVGQGDAILIDHGETEILIDGGDRSPGVVNYLESYINGPLEVIVATHPHADHIGGLIDVFAQFDILEVWTNGDTSTSGTYTDFTAAITAEGLDSRLARVQNTITAGALTLQIYHPADTKGSTNNNSVVLGLQYGDVNFLFMGDAEQEAEAVMLNNPALSLPDTDILKVGHHGSRTASSAVFLEVIQPETAIYMAKTGNSYGHPHEEAIANLTAAGATIYGTDTRGTITVTSDGQTYSVSTER